MGDKYPLAQATAERWETLPVLAYAARDIVVGIDHQP
jgi:hypothetical protein